MSEEKKQDRSDTIPGPPPNIEPPRRRSGEMLEVKTFRKKMDSIETTTLPKVKRMREDIRRMGEALKHPRQEGEEDLVDEEADTLELPVTEAFEPDTKDAAGETKEDEPS